MRMRTLGMTLALSAIVIAPALAQPPAPPPAPTAPRQRTPAPAVPPSPAAPRAAQAPEAPPPPPVPRHEGQPVNIKIDVTITDQGRVGAPSAKKTVTIVTADGMNGRIRSEANYQNVGQVPLNIDAEPEIIADGKMRVRVNLQYSLPGAAGESSGPTTAAGLLRSTSIQENLSVILESGKSVVAAQSADPVGDRQVTIEVKATILR